MTSLTINDPGILRNRMERMERNAMNAAAISGKKTETAVRINGVNLVFAATPSVQEGRFYRLWYRNGKRTPKRMVPASVLPPAA